MITDDDPTIEYPSSLAFILPHDLYDAILFDVIYDSAGNGKPYLTHVFDFLMHNDGPGAIRASKDVFHAVATHPEAEKWYRENIWLNDDE